MKITFVGTSHGVPSANRFCSCYMIESGNGVYMVDAGAPAADCIIRAGRDVNDFKAIFTTHVHTDHTAGVLGLISVMNWHYKRSSGEFFFTSEAQVKAIEAWFAAAADPLKSDGRLRLRVAKTGEVYSDENIRVEYIPNQHMANSYSILVSEGEKRVLFGGDFSNGLRSRDVPEVIGESIDLFICELAHFTAADIAPYLEKCGAEAVAFTHVFPLEKYGDIDKIKGLYPCKIITPNDGDFVEI